VVFHYASPVEENLRTRLLWWILRLIFGLLVKQAWRFHRRDIAGGDAMYSARATGRTV
jgi:hypothetical protein